MKLLTTRCHQFLEDRGHTLVVTSDKDGAGCELEKHLPDTDIVMSQPFWWRACELRASSPDTTRPCHITGRRI